MFADAPEPLMVTGRDVRLSFPGPESAYTPAEAPRSSTPPRREESRSVLTDTTGLSYANSVGRESPLAQSAPFESTPRREPVRDGNTPCTTVRMIRSDSADRLAAAKQRAFLREQPQNMPREWAPSFLGPVAPKGASALGVEGLELPASDTTMRPSNAFESAIVFPAPKAESGPVSSGTAVESAFAGPVPSAETGAAPPVSGADPAAPWESANAPKEEATKEPHVETIVPAKGPEPEAHLAAVPPIKGAEPTFAVPWEEPTEPEAHLAAVPPIKGAEPTFAVPWEAPSTTGPELEATITGKAPHLEAAVPSAGASEPEAAIPTKEPHLEAVVPPAPELFAAPRIEAPEPETAASSKPHLEAVPPAEAPRHEGALAAEELHRESIVPPAKVPEPFAIPWEAAPEPVAKSPVLEAIVPPATEPELVTVPGEVPAAPDPFTGPADHAPEAPPSLSEHFVEAPEAAPSTSSHGTVVPVPPPSFANSTQPKDVPPSTAEPTISRSSTGHSADETLHAKSPSATPSKTGTQATPALAGFTPRSAGSVFARAQESANPFQREVAAAATLPPSGAPPLGASVFHEEFSFDNVRGVPTEPRQTTATIRIVGGGGAGVPEESPSAPSISSFETAQDHRRFSRDMSLKAATEPLRVPKRPREPRLRAPSLTAFMSNASTTVERTVSRISSQLHLRPSMQNLREGRSASAGAPRAAETAAEDADTSFPGSYIF